MRIEAEDEARQLAVSSLKKQLITNIFFKFQAKNLEDESERLKMEAELREKQDAIAAMEENERRKQQEIEDAQNEV